MQRSKEMTLNAKAAVEEAIGDRAKDMLYVNVLATAPAEQGRGYGGAVLDNITKEVGSSQLDLQTHAHVHV